MAKRGRPPEGARLVEGLEASGQAKRRLQLILETMAGERTVGDACVELGIGESRFHQLRQEALSAAMQGLEPRPTGRPRHQESEESARIVELKERVAGLQEELLASQVREELALTMPHLLTRSKKKTPSSPRRARRGNDAKSDT